MTELEGLFQVHEDAEASLLAGIAIPERTPCLASDSRKLLVKADDGQWVFFESGEKLAAATRGAASGVAPLDSNQKVPSANLPGALPSLASTSPTTYGKGFLGLSAAADALSYTGAEPALGAPAGTSFLRSTAAGVRAWVQLGALAFLDAITDAQVAGNAAISWGKISKVGSEAVDVGALPQITLTGVIDFNAINSGAPCVAALAGTSYLHSPWPSPGPIDEGTLIQLVSKAGRMTQLLIDNHFGGTSIRMQPIVNSGNWTPWELMWGSLSLPVSTFVKTLLDDANSAAARITLGAAPLAGSPVMIHSDFGVSPSSDIWQSAFTDNTSSGLQLAASSVANGTRITIEQVVEIELDTFGVYQLCIGPLLGSDGQPSAGTYLNLFDPGAVYGQGILTVKIEFIVQSASVILAYVTSSFDRGGTNPPKISSGVIPVDRTQVRTIDIRFNPYGSPAGYQIRRNRVYRTNP